MPLPHYHIRIEPGPGCDHSPGAFHWAIYEHDDFIGFGNRWYENRAGAVAEFRLLFPTSSLPIFNTYGTHADPRVVPYKDD